MRISKVMLATGCAVALALMGSGLNTTASSTFKTVPASVGNPLNIAFNSTSAGEESAANPGDGLARLRSGGHYFAGPFG